MKIYISGIGMEVRRKKIKNLYLSIRPPDGRVEISAPLSMPDKMIEDFVREKLEWIRRKRKKYEEVCPEKERQYESGEILYVWGKPYRLVYQEGGRKNSFELCGDEGILSMRSGSTAKQREAYLREQYRLMLKEEVARLLPEWEMKTGLYCNSWRTKQMKTRWGTCNTTQKRVWFNVQLAEKPKECLEYVILHELAQLKVSNHGMAFRAIMDKHMPQWQEVKKKLNGG